MQEPSITAALQQLESTRRDLAENLGGTPYAAGYAQHRALLAINDALRTLLLAERERQHRHRELFGPFEELVHDNPHSEVVINRR